MNAAEIVVAEGLRKEFSLRSKAGGDSTLVAVGGVSMRLFDGESVGLVGESGSGKSTLARLIAGLETPTAGLVEVCGNPRGHGRPRGARRRSWGRELQLVFQDPYSSLDPRQRVIDAIEEILSFQFGLSGAERRSRGMAILEQVGLDERRGCQRPASLSGGERQRAAIARAIAAEPRLLILDEAVSALDVSIQAQILNLLVDLRQTTGMAYLVLSHDLSIVRYVTDRILVMRYGLVVEAGPTEDVFTHPSVDYTKLLLSCAPRPGWKPKRVRGLDDVVGGAGSA